MAYKLAVDDKVGVQIKGKMRTKDGKEKEFAFVLVCDRLTQSEMQAEGADGGTTIAFFEKHALDWQRQDLVLDEDDKPAAFSLEALQALMTITGMSTLCWHSYIQQVQAVAKN